MVYYALKLVISAVLIVVISEVAKRSSLIGALIASLPLVSILAFVWLYIDSGSAQKVSALSYSIFWLVLPSLSLFIALPLLLSRTGNFYLSLAGAIGIMLLVYAAMLEILRWFELRL